MTWGQFLASAVLAALIALGAKSFADVEALICQERACEAKGGVLITMKGKYTCIKAEIINLN